MLLKIHKLQKMKGNFQLDDISFDLPKGYIMGLIGPNGAGKTTLLHMIAGLYEQNTGSIEIDGKEIWTHEKEVKNLIGYVSTEEFFLQELSLIKNADMHGKYYKLYSRSEFLEYCERFHLDSKQKLKNLSRGEKLKFQMAFAMAHKPRLLVLDEPTANFDPEFRSDFLAILSDFVASGENSVLLATHITEDLDRIADYMVMLYQGKILCSLDREALEDNYRLAAGDDYKIELLKPEQIIYAEKGAYATRALLHHKPHMKYDKELEITVPTTEDLMYYMVKGME